MPHTGPERALTLTSYLCKGLLVDGATPSPTHRDTLTSLQRDRILNAPGNNLPGVLVFYFTE